MGLFDKLKRGKSNLTMDAIICEEYEQQYFDECKYIWKNYVPQAGQADNLQGELLKIGRASVGKECVRRCRSRWSPYH